jgi:hypothetical protein
MHEGGLLTHVIMGFFLFLVFIQTCRYLCEVYGYRKGWMRIPLPIFIMLVMGIGAISGLLLLSLGPSEALLALAVGGGICISVFHPMASIAIFISNLLVRPWESFDGNAILESLPRLFAVISIGSWVLSRFLRRQMTFVWARGLTLFTLIYCWLLISALSSPYSSENFDVIFKTFLPIFVVCILIVNSVQKKNDLDLLERALTLSVTSVIAVAIVMTVSNPLYWAGGVRLEGPGLSGNSNDLAALAVLALPFLMVPTLRAFATRKYLKFDIFCMGILVTGLLMTKSRASVIALAGSCVMYLYIVSKSKKRLVMWLIACLPVFLGIMAIAMQRDQSDLEGSSESRLGYIYAGFRMLRAHPLMGVGVENYPRFYEQFTSSYIETGLRTCHSTWMLFLSETGPIGLGLFATLFFSAVGQAWRMRKTYPQFIMAALSYGITMSVLSHSYTIFPYFLIFLIISAYRVLGPSPL